MNIQTDSWRRDGSRHASLNDAMRRVQGEADPNGYVDTGRIMRAVRRQLWVIALCATIGAVVMIAYALTVSPQYTASATILLDEERADLLNLISDVPAAAMRDGSIESEIEILKSHELALRVVDRQNLMNRPGILKVAPSPVDSAINTVKGWAGDILDAISTDEEPVVLTDGEPDEVDPRRDVASVLVRNLEVERVGRSYVLSIYLTAPTRQLAHEITQAYANAYLSFQLEANATAADSAIAWLEERVDVLRDQNLDASKKLETFRRENRLVSIGDRLLSQQELSEIMSQLISAEANAARANAVATQMEEALEGGPEAALANLTSRDGDSLDTVAQDLNVRYVNTTRQLRRVLEEYPSTHPEAERLRTELEATKQLIFDELTRRATRARNAYNAEQSSVASLRAGLDSALSDGTTDASALYNLRQLEQTEESYKDLYQSALVRLERAQQQRSVPIVAARIITSPDVPTGQSQPQRLKLLALGVIMGGLVGGGIGVLRENGGTTLRTRGDVQDHVGLPLITTLPRRPRSRRLTPWGKGRGTARAPQVDKALLQAVRVMKLALDDVTPRRGARSLAFISAEPGEGKTMLAMNFAAMLAEHGFRTLLIDAAPPEMTIAKTFRTDRSVNLVSVIARDEPVTLSELQRVGDVPLFVLPLSPPDNPYSGIVYAGTAQMDELLANLAQQADYIIFDVPAASAGPDARAFADHVQAAVVVNRKGKADATQVRAMVELPAWSRKAIGVVLNQG